MLPRAFRSAAVPNRLATNFACILNFACPLSLASLLTLLYFRLMIHSVAAFRVYQ